MKEKINWSQFTRGVFIVNCLAIIFDSKTGRILIGKREEDPYIKKLGWGFPGGRPAYKQSMEDYLKLEVKKKTNLKIKVKNVVFAKTYSEDHRFLSIYYLTEVIGGKEKAGEKFVEIKWVKPQELKKYFATSFHPRLYSIIVNLSKSTKGKKK